MFSFPVPILPTASFWATIIAIRIEGAAEDEEFRPVAPFTDGGLYEMEDYEVEYLQPSASFVRPFAVPTERRHQRRRVKKEEGL